MSTRYNYSKLIKNLFNQNYNDKNNLIEKEITNINYSKVYILNNKTIENIYKKVQKMMYNFYLKLTKIVHVQ